jgi:nicotinamide mononucleotide transporter
MSDSTPDPVVPGRFALDAWLVGLASIVLLACSAFKWLPIDLTEAFGFVTGAVCVWLVTKENLWNWPIGIANNLFFAVLFWKTRLYADFGLQWVYLVLGIYGWWEWLYGGKNRTALTITKASMFDWIAIAIFIPAGTWGMRAVLLASNDAAPFLDAFTTILSLAAQYLLCRKRLENWFIWILADLIYVPLYLHRDLPLTALLYAAFIALCLLGLKRWRKDLRP